MYRALHSAVARVVATVRRLQSRAESAGLRVNARAGAAGIAGLPGAAPGYRRLAGSSPM